MAEKRMFAKSIVFQDDFLDMPMSSRCLYFSLSMVADDDGFVDSYRSVMRQIGATVDDLRILLAKRYIIAFDTGVIVIRHWRINNYLRSDRYRETQYQDEMASLTISKTGEYVPSNALCTTVNSGNTNGIPDGIPTVCVEENSTVKNSIEENIPQSQDALFDKFWEVYPKRKCKGDAKKAFTKAIKEKGVTIEILIDAIEAQKKTTMWQKEKGAYIPYPATWLNGRRWEDEINSSDFQKTDGSSKPKGNTLSDSMTHGYDMDELRRRAKE